MTRAARGRRLAMLRHLEDSATRSVEGVAGRADDEALEARVRRIADDHERHVRELDDALELLHRRPGSGLPEDFRESVGARTAALDAAEGRSETLREVLVTERFAAGQYEDALASGEVGDLDGLLARHLADERSHAYALEHVFGGR
ncbi:MAG: ferritin-like domain-containing protein [Coriobacteriia bacterium]|nr:ferritin-like domain-containing protein [Coriobacteriia bacterium]